MFLFTNPKPGSHTWNSISKAKRDLTEGYSFRLGDGATSIWFQPWTHFGCLGSQVQYVDIHDRDYTIKDIIQNGAWNLNVLHTNLSQNTANHIHDCFIWQSHLNGAYTANAGYKWLISRYNTNSATTLDPWNWIWKDFIPEKIKILIGCACHNSLPFAAMLHHRGIINSPMCTRCNTPIEDPIHILWDCPLSPDLECSESARRRFLHYFFNLQLVQTWPHEQLSCQVSGQCVVGLTC